MYVPLDESLAAQFRVLDALPQIAWCSDPNGANIFVNRLMSQYTGRAREDLLGYRFSEVVHEDDRERLLETWQASWLDGHPYECEFRLRAGEGTYRWFCALGNPVLTEEGDLHYWVGTCHDIHALKEHEARLLEREARQQQLLDHNLAGILTLDEQGVITYANPAFLKLLGLAAGEVVGQLSWRALTPPEDWPADARAAQKLREWGFVAPYEKAFVGKSGGRVPVLVGASRLPGEGEHTVAFVLDLTARKWAEDAWQESQRQLQALLDHTSAVVHLKDPQGRFLLVNQAFCDLVGRSAQEIVGRTPFDLFPPQVAAQHLRHDQRVLASKAPLSEEELAPDGDGLRTYWSVKFPVFDAAGEVSGVGGISSDITERRRSQSLLERQASLLDLSHDATLVWTMDGGIDFWNKGAQRMYGFTPEQALGQSPHTLLRTRPEEGSLEDIERCLAVRGAWEGVLCHTAQDGRELAIESRMVVVPGEAGERTVLETNRDITIRHRALRALRDSEERLRLALEAGQLGAWEWDVRTGALRRSQQLQRMLDLPQESSSLESFFQLVHEGDLERVRSLFREAGQGRLGHYSFTYRAYTPGGELVWLEQHAQVVRGEGGQVERVIGVTADITARKRAEQAMHDQQELLEARVQERTRRWQDLNSELRSLAGAASHELQEPLRRLRGFLHLLERRAAGSLDQKTVGYIQQIQAEAERAERLAENFSALAHLENRELRLSDVPLTPLVTQVRSDLTPSLQGRPVKWTVAELPTVRGDTLLLRQAFSELLRYALRRVPGGQHPSVSVHAGGSGPTRIVIEVSPLDLSSAAFLEDGLSNARRIAQRHGGTLNVQMQGDQTVFELNLPGR